VDVRPLGSALASAQTKTLVRTDQVEVIRLVVPAGKEIEEHKAKGEITVQCLEGQVSFTAFGKTVILPPTISCARAAQAIFLRTNSASAAVATRVAIPTAYIGNQRQPIELVKLPNCAILHLWR
jgi:hypothetical protein